MAGLILKDYRELGNITLIANAYGVLTKYQALGRVLYRGHPT